jgi:hypothetical protein
MNKNRDKRKQSTPNGIQVNFGKNQIILHGNDQDFRKPVDKNNW